MIAISEINTWKDLAEYIVQSFPPDLQSNIQRAFEGDETPISWGSYKSLVKGVVPGDNLQRKLRSYMETKFGLTVQDLGDGKIQVVKKQIVNVKGDYYFNQQKNNSSDLERTNYLLDKIRVLESEILILREKLSKYEQG